jgi:hypothetical protein
MDLGTEGEITIEAWSSQLGNTKLDQLWDDLVDNGQVILTIPRLGLFLSKTRLIPRSNSCPGTGLSCLQEK